MNNCTFGQTNTTNILSISRNGRSLTPIKNQLHSMTIHCVLETIQFAQRRTINSTFVQPFIQNGQSLTWTDKYWCFSNNRKKKYSSVLFMLVTCILKYWPKIQEYVHYLNFVSFCTIFCWSRNKINIWHVQYTVRNCTLYEQVDALETNTTEENHATKKQNPTWTATKNYSSLRRC